MKLTHQPQPADNSSVRACARSNQRTVIMTSDNRSLKDAELHEVNGGIISPAVVAFAYGYGCTMAANAILGGYVGDAAAHAAGCTKSITVDPDRRTGGAHKGERPCPSP